MSALDPGTPPGTPPGRRPLARQVAQWRVYLPFYARVLALQGSHPTVAAALVEHSSVFDDPFGRVARTTGYAMRLMFGTGGEPEQTAAELRRLHGGVRGVDDEGRRYSAFDRDVWAWVHLTTAESLLYALDVMCGPLPARHLEAFYQETRRTGALYGVGQDDMPYCLGDLRAYVDDGIATKLRPNPATDRFRRAVRAGDHLRALPLPPLPRAVLGRVMARPADALLFGAFPDPVRRMWGVRWNPLRQASYAATVVALRAATDPLPDRLRMVPTAYRALRDRPA